MQGAFSFRAAGTPLWHTWGTLLWFALGSVQPLEEDEKQEDEQEYGHHHLGVHVQRGVDLFLTQGLVDWIHLTF